MNFTKRLLAIFIASVIAIFLTLFLFWIRHRVGFDMNPMLGLVFPFLFLVIVIILIITGIKGVETFLLDKNKFTPAMLFAFGFTTWMISSLLSMFGMNSTLDIHLHDTYYVIAGATAMIRISTYFGMLGLIYYLFPKIFGRYMENYIAYIHFWVTFVGVFLLFWPIYFGGSAYEGLTGMPRRYVEYSGWSSFNQLVNLKRFYSFVAIVVFTVQVVFVFNFFYCIFWGERVKAVN
jgi:cytochrome c oxidase subunit 1